MEKPKLIEDLGRQYPDVDSKMNKRRPLDGNNKYKYRYGIFECPVCKKHYKTAIRLVNAGLSNCCGCTRVGRHRMSKTKIHSKYLGMLNRCYNKKNNTYNRYGGRGVFVCEEWRNDFMTFYNWAMTNGYQDDLQIDRIDCHGNYSPDNCRFVDRCTNSQNTRLIIESNTSGYRGVCYKKDGKRKKRWYVIISNNRKKHYLGFYVTPEEAALAYNNFVITNKTNHPLNIIHSE